MDLLLYHIFSDNNQLNNNDRFIKLYLEPLNMRGLKFYFKVLPGNIQLVHMMKLFNIRTS